MPFSTKNVQTAKFYHTLVILFALTPLLLEQFVYLPLGHVSEILLYRLLFLSTVVFVLHRHLADEVDVLGMFAQDGISITVGVTSQDDIGTAAGHVGGNGHGAAATGLRDNLRLTLVVFSVQDVVRYALLIQ